jgi:Fur family ferric uptake transcriptional regulator
MTKRNTPSKQVVLDYFKTHRSGLRPEHLINEFKQYDKVTIYRILQSFLEDGLIHKSVSEAGFTHYFICKTQQGKHFHNHYHFKCSQCEKVICIDREIEINLPKGYILENVNFWITGICDNCNKKINLSNSNEKDNKS